MVHDINDADAVNGLGPSADPCLVSLGLLIVLMAVTSLRGLPRTPSTALPEPVPATINPNTAPWWELTVLPRIGEQTARKIVLYRESAGVWPGDHPTEPVFHTSGDLTQVRGIGPRTLLRIGRHLRFD